MLKFSSTVCSTFTPEVVATGVAGGGYVVIKTSSSYGSAQIGMSPSDFPTLKSETKFATAGFPYIEGNKIWLNEGEQLYGRANYYAYDNSTKPSIYNVVYLNSEPTAQTNTQTPPINLTGTIQLNQQ